MTHDGSLRRLGAEKLIVFVFGAFFGEHTINLLLDRHQIIIIILLLAMVMFLLSCVLSLCVFFLV